MRAIVVAVASCIAVLAFGGPGGAVEYRCPAEGISQCQALNVAGQDTCFQWACVAGPPRPGAPPSSIPGVSSNWSCTQVQQPLNASCTNRQGCVTGGRCSPTGNCEPVQNGHVTCSAPPNALYTCQCVYKNGTDQCQPFSSPGKPAASGMCKMGTD